MTCQPTLTPPPHEIDIPAMREKYRHEREKRLRTEGEAQYVRDSLGLKVCAVAQLSDLLAYLSTQSDSAMAQHLPAVQAYRDRYGVA